jgi:hypothetical protein
MRLVLSERNFHKLNVFFIRACSFPIRKSLFTHVHACRVLMADLGDDALGFAVIFISLHERQVFRRSAFVERAGAWFEDVLEMLPRGLQQMRTLNPPLLSHLSLISNGRSSC